MLTDWLTFNYNSNSNNNNYVIFCGFFAANKKKVWEPANIAKLLQLIKNYIGQLKDKRTAKSTVWDKVAGEMGDGFDGNFCGQKWRNLKETYKQFEKNKTKTGAGSRPIPAFYAELHELLAKDHTINPVALFDLRKKAPSAIGVFGDGNSATEDDCATHKVCSALFYKFGFYAHQYYAWSRE